MAILYFKKANKIDKRNLDVYHQLIRLSYKIKKLATARRWAYKL